MVVVGEGSRAMARHDAGVRTALFLLLRRRRRNSAAPSAVNEGFLPSYFPSRLAIAIL
jgi:hypothetical protein